MNRMTPFGDLSPSFASFVRPGRFDLLVRSIQLHGGSGGNGQVQVFLTQTSPTTILTVEGLFSAGVRVAFNGAPLPVTSGGADHR